MFTNTVLNMYKYVYHRRTATPIPLLRITLVDDFLSACVGLVFILQHDIEEQKTCFIDNLHAYVCILCNRNCLH